ncbi:hypothetical protein BDN67DRAFT_983299 [Paxillus ammoniavirescens]|nr:hypothetical protein BDN67DRAFT_983299 [Paxillus ammoniavirescens]
MSNLCFHSQPNVDQPESSWRFALPKLRPHQRPQQPFILCLNMSSNTNLAAILLLLEGMTLTSVEALRVNSAVKAAADLPDTTSVLSLSSCPISNIDPSTSLDLLTPTDTATTTRLGADTDVDVDADILNVAPTSSASASPPSVNPAATMLPISTITVGGKIRYQQTYRGFSFDVPKARALGPFYLVTRG